LKKTKLEGIIGIKNLWRKRNRGNTNFALRLLCPIVAMGRKLDRSEAKRETKTLKTKDWRFEVRCYEEFEIEIEEIEVTERRVSVEILLLLSYGEFLLYCPFVCV
jgi:hypothetical protein